MTTLLGVVPLGSRLIYIVPTIVHQHHRVAFLSSSISSFFDRAHNKRSGGKNWFKRSTELTKHTRPCVPLSSGGNAVGSAGVSFSMKACGRERLWGPRAGCPGDSTRLAVGNDSSSHLLQTSCASELADGETMDAGAWDGPGNWVNVNLSHCSTFRSLVQ